MRLRVFRGRPCDQRGFALIAILSLAMLITAYLVVNTLAGLGSPTEREQRNMDALRKAKAALIAYAASTEGWQAFMGQANDQPGALPCPDILLDDGIADCVGAGISATSSLVGRLPWQTMGIEDLRDASGERLWYALSHDFRKLQCSLPPAAPVNGCTTVNSDTQGQLTVTGTAPANNVVAIVFAPGQALDLSPIGGPVQNRPSNPADPVHNDPANYLEGFDPVNFIFTTNATPSGTFNDRVLVITQAELMAAVEPVVAARIERDVKPVLADYFGKWGAYPFAAPLDIGGPPPSDPGRPQSAYKGVANQKVGLLPLTTDPNWYKWGSSTVTTIVNGGTGIYAGPGGATITSDPTNCTVGALQVVCTVDYPGDGNDRPMIKIQIFLQNKDMALADLPGPFSSTDWQNVTMTDSGGNPLSMLIYGQWSNTLLPTGAAFSAPTGVVTYTGRLRPADSVGYRVTITVPIPAANYLPGLTGANMAWFISNQWYRQTYYAVSPGWVPGAGGACNPLPGTPSCLKVNNLPPSYATANDKRAILVLAGRALSGTRPSSSFADYLEGANLTAATGTTFTYEHRAGTPTSINDRVVVISP